MRLLMVSLLSMEYDPPNAQAPPFHCGDFRRRRTRRAAELLPPDRPNPVRGAGIDANGSGEPQRGIVGLSRGFGSKSESERTAGNTVLGPVAERVDSGPPERGLEDGKRLVAPRRLPKGGTVSGQ